MTRSATGDIYFKYWCVCEATNADGNIESQTINEIGAVVHWKIRTTLAKNEMNEEQPTFKVTDRRLFNADGSPREVPPEEKPEPPVAVVEAPAQLETPAPEVQATPAEPEPIEVAEADDDEMSEEELADARDPASFLNFLMSLASNAASSLGMMEHPVTHQRDVDLELGKHWIDVLGMLEKKTRGNLTPPEKKMLDGLLDDLRMQYVSLANTAKPRAFSGKDITGGR